MIKIKHISYIIVLLCVFSINAKANPFVRLDSTSLAKSKEMLKNGTAPEKTLAAYEKLIKASDKLLEIKNPTVIDKTILPPTGSKNDYLSVSRYWWPDTKKEDGLPWIRNDGKTNPDTQTDAVDRQRLSRMARGVWSLSLAYYFTGDEKYAKKAISMIDTWFLDPATLMNPNLEYAQSVPGNPSKRRSGILDGRSIAMFVPDAINLLSSSKQWGNSHDSKMTKWFTDYLTWLTESDLGIEGSKQENNHGSWYRFQVASLAIYLGDNDLAKNMVELSQKSLDQMLNSDGGQIHELARTKSFSYSCFNLQALADIAVLGDKVGMNMWEYESEDKKSLSLALNYLTPVVDGETWKHNTLKPINIKSLVPIISLAYNKFDTPEYRNLLLKSLKTIEEDEQNYTMLEFWLFNNPN